MCLKLRKNYQEKAHGRAEMKFNWLKTRKLYLHALKLPLILLFDWLNNFVTLFFLIWADFHLIGLYAVDFYLFIEDSIILHCSDKYKNYKYFKNIIKIDSNMNNSVKYKNCCDILSVSLEWRKWINLKDQFNFIYQKHWFYLNF